MAKKMPLGTAALRAINHEIGNQRLAGHKVPDTVLARALGVSNNTVGRRLSGSGKLTVDELETMAEALGLSVDELWRRARAEQDQADPEAIAESALSQLPADAQAEIAKVAADLRPKRDAPQTGRAANGDAGH